MRQLFASLACAFLFAAIPAAHSQTPTPTHPWTVQEIYGGGDLTGYPPSGISWSPDGSRATYIDGDGNVMQIQISDGKLTKLIDHAKIDFLLDAKISEQD
ncbi:MAG TPA: dipeptidyl-peptidase IV, partial [Acidobacteriaceae bacterium]|nr:dipeptidyl-peptidase IV [Acidobacteriaceae bacterium]